jgi:DNA polymerase-4
VFSGNFKTYRKYSDKLYNLLLEYTDKIERYSIDECFLDMTNFLLNSTLQEKANEISKRVKEELGFTVNIGISNNKLLAKMASDFEKPDKVHTLFKNEIESKMWPLPVKELFMLGRKTYPKLYNMGIKTIGDLAKTDKQLLIKLFGKHGSLMWEYANGIDNSPVKYIKEDPKSIGNSVTLPRDVYKIEELEEVLLALVEQVTYRLRKNKLFATTVNVQLRTKDFEDFSHQKKLNIATSNTKDIYAKAKEILKEMYKNQKPIRLIGARVDGLIKKDEMQLSLFENKSDIKQEKLDNIIDNLNEKYGYNSITRAGKLNIDKIVDINRK